MKHVPLRLGANPQANIKQQGDLMPCYCDREMEMETAETHLPIPALLRNGAGDEVIEVTPCVTPADHELGKGREIDDPDTVCHDLVLPPHGLAPVGPVFAVRWVWRSQYCVFCVLVMFPSPMKGVQRSAIMPH